MKNTILAIITITYFLFSSCEKAGTGGDASIAIWVKHHNELIPAATVFIKYNAKEFPGDDISLYDDSATCGTNGQEEGHTHFEGLNKGDYYLYAIGYDSTISDSVKGGIPFQITKENKSGETEVDMPVTEE